MSDVKIEIRGLCKFFQGRRVLDGVDLDVRQGQTLVIIGRSGCGAEQCSRPQPAGGAQLDAA